MGSKGTADLSRTVLAFAGPNAARGSSRKPHDREHAPAAEVERPIFLLNSLYGTRCSTVVAVDRAGRGRIWERRFDAAGAVTGETEIAFHWLI